jgi:hypothetical protein
MLMSWEKSGRKEGLTVAETAQKQNIGAKLKKHEQAKKDLMKAISCYEETCGFRLETIRVKHREGKAESFLALPG